MDANGELTAAELTLLRTHPQRTDLHIAIPDYATVFTAVVNAPTPANNDGVYQVTFTGGSGAAFSNVVSGMTLLVGTSPLASDVGIARIRAAITSGDVGITGTIYIGTTSEIEFVVGQNLTITNEFGLWPRHPYVDPVTGEEFMDWNIDYGGFADAPHVYFAPVPNMLPSAVVDLTKATAYGVEFNTSSAWTPYDLLVGLPITYTCNWSCTGASSITVSPFGTPATFRFTSTGTYLVKLELIATWATGQTQTTYSYRYVIVYDDASPLIKAPILESCEGDFNSGGWSYHVTLYSQANLATIHNRTLCILVADDWYGTTHSIQRPNRIDGSVFPLNQNYGTGIGPIIDRENIVCIGWIDGESITWSNDTGSVSFDVHGPQWWLDRMEGFPTGVDDTTAAPTAWTQINNLTAQKGLWHFLYWRTTAANVMDIPQCGRFSYAAGPDPRRLPTTYTPAGSLWEQLRAIADRIFARAACNRYGQLFINVDSQLIDPSGPAFLRGTHPNIMGAFGAPITDADWRDEITIERNTVSPASIVNLSGIYWDGTIAGSSALFALSPGHYYKHFGYPESRDRIALSSQAQAITLAGLYAGWLNNEYPNVDVPLSSNNRCFDIAPYMFSWMAIVAADTPRGIEWPDAWDEAQGKRLIPRRVSFTRDDREAVMLTDVTFEAETFAETAMIGDAPLTPPDPPPPPDPPIPEEPPVPVLPAMMVLMTPRHLGRTFNWFTTDPTEWEDIGPRVGHEATIGYYRCFDVDEVTAEAWIVTKADVGTDAQNGLFYCADTSATVPVWTLVYTQADYDTDAEVISPVAGRLNTCIMDGNRNVFAQADYSSQDYGSYVWGTSASVVFVSALGFAHDYYNVGAEFGMYGDATSARCVLGQPTNDGVRIIKMTGGTPTSVFQNYNAKMLSSIHKNHFILNHSGGVYDYDLCSYVDQAGESPGGVEPCNYTFVWQDAWSLRPIVITDGHYFWTRITDGALMIDGAVQALVNTVGPTTGVFSNAGASGGAYCNVVTYGHIAWVADSADALNTIRNIAYTQDGGVTWETKDGVGATGWAGAMGEAYEGNASISVPMIKYVQGAP